MPKVIQVSTYFQPAVGGVERQAEEIAAHLASSGYEVEVYATTADHAGGQVTAPAIETYRGYTVRRFKPWLRLGHFFQTAPGLITQVAKADFDVLHVHNLHDGHLLLLILTCSLRRKKLVVTGHNPFVVGAEKRGGILNRFVEFHDLIVRFFSPDIYTYIALLQSEKRVVEIKLGLPSRKVVVIPNGIEDKYYEKQGDSKNFYSEWNIKRESWDLIVGSACRMNYVKGIQNLVEVAKKLPNVLFVFAGGDDGYLLELQKMFSGFSNVIFTERYLKGSQMLDFYDAIDLFLLPSVYEPFGMTVVEAMAQGKVVLATNNGGPPDIIPQDAGKTLDPNDTEKWVEYISEYVSDDAQLASQSEKAKEAAQRYRWAAVIDQIKKIYD